MEYNKSKKERKEEKRKEKGKEKEENDENANSLPKKISLTFLKETVQQDAFPFKTLYRKPNEKSNKVDL